MEELVLIIRRVMEVAVLYNSCHDSTTSVLFVLRDGTHATPISPVVQRLPC